MLGYVNEITRYLDTQIKPKDKCDIFYVYIYTKDGVPEKFDVNKDQYCWFLRYPGYTCANIVFNKSDDTIDRVVLTHRGGLFVGEDETVFIDPDKIEKELTEKYKGKTISYEDKFKSAIH